MSSGLMSQALYHQIAEAIHRVDRLTRELNKLKSNPQVDNKEEFSVTVRNDSGEVVPPFAAMEVTGTILNSNRQTITVRKPTGDPEKPHLFNGVRQIEIGEFGQGFYGLSQVALTGLLAVGTAIGVSNDSWALSQSDQPIARLLGSITATEGIAVPIAGGGGGASIEWVEAVYEGVDLPVSSATFTAKVINRHLGSTPNDTVITCENPSYGTPSPSEHLFALIDGMVISAIKTDRLIGSEPVWHPTIGGSARVVEPVVTPPNP